jgi:hypothetical protein
LKLEGQEGKRKRRKVRRNTVYKDRKKIKIWSSRGEKERERKSKC